MWAFAVDNQVGPQVLEVFGPVVKGFLGWLVSGSSRALLAMGNWRSTLSRGSISIPSLRVPLIACEASPVPIQEKVGHGWCPCVLYT